MRLAVVWAQNDAEPKPETDGLGSGSGGRSASELAEQAIRGERFRWAAVLYIWRDWSGDGGGLNWLFVQYNVVAQAYLRRGKPECVGSRSHKKDCTAARR